MRSAKTFVGICGRLTTVCWLFQVMLPAMCCCCADRTAIFSSANGLACRASTCCVASVFGPSVCVTDATASSSARDCRGLCCENCASYGGFHGLESREATLRSRQVESSEALADQPVFGSLGFVSHSTNRLRSARYGADTLNNGAVLSAADRCVNLERLLL